MRLVTRAIAYVERTGIWIPILVIGFLVLPMLVTPRSFGPDWTLHLWAVRQQQWNIEAMGHPGLFVSVRQFGAFYPLFAFVGSGIYSLGGLLALVIGPIAAYKALFLLALGLAYVGCTWIAVMFDVRGWRSQVPGAVFVTSAYYVTNMVGRGDLGELMALSSLPFVIAGICALLSLRQVRLRHRLAVVLGVFVLSGSHNITLLWGSTFIVLLGIVAAIAWGSAWPRPWPWRRIGQLAGLGLIGAGLNAWYLFPDLAYGLDTVVGSIAQHTRPGSVYVHGSLLLNPFRPADHPNGLLSLFAREVRLALPVFFALWAFVVAIFTWRRWSGAQRRLFGGVLLITAVFTVLLVDERVWEVLPRVFWAAQFTFRLDGYVVLGVVMLVMISIAGLIRMPSTAARWAKGALIVIVVFNGLAATWQVMHVRSEYINGGRQVRTDSNFLDSVVEDRTALPPSWYAGPDFRDVSATVVATAPNRRLTVPVGRVKGSSFVGVLPVPDGSAPFLTNISAGPRLLRMTGIRAVGGSRFGLVVAVRAPGTPATGPVRVTIRPVDTGPVRAGAIVSLLSLGALLLLVAWSAVWSIRRRRVRPATVAGSQGAAASAGAADVLSPM